MAAEKLVLSPEQIGAGIPEVLKIGQAHFVSQCLYLVVKLGVPDVIGDGSLTVDQIAAKLPGSPNKDGLKRCLRLLAVNGVFNETEAAGDFAFSLTPAGALLQTGAPQPSMACGILHWMERPSWGAWSEVPSYVAGETSADPYTSYNGKPVFDYYREHPESAEPFNEFMSFFSDGELPVLLENGPWAELAGRTVVDVGGNYGAVMGAVVAKYPEIKAFSLDLPEVIDKAPAPAPGVQLVKGDMFDSSTIPACDVIFMKHILHDWSDEASVRILKSCHTALNAGGEVHIVEAILPNPGQAGPDVSPALHLDLFMLVVGGKERTRTQWEALASESGFSIKEVRITGHPTGNFIILAKI